MLTYLKDVRHVGIVVSNIERSLHFYRDILGLKIVRTLEESGEFIDNALSLNNVKVKTVKMLANNNSTLVELLEFKSHPRLPKNDVTIFEIGVSHVAFTVNNLDEVYSRWSQAGIKFNAPPQLTPDGYAKITFCYDPDNTPLELIEVVDQTVLLNNKTNKQ